MLMEFIVPVLLLSHVYHVTKLLTSLICKQLFDIIGLCWPAILMFHMETTQEDLNTGIYSSSVHVSPDVCELPWQYV